MTRYRRLSESAAAFILLLLVAFAGLPSAFGQSVAHTALPRRLVGDYGYWSRTQTPPYSSAQIPFGKLTHINHAGVSMNSDGTLDVPSGFLEPALIEKAHAAGVKVMLLLGGSFTSIDGDPTVLHTLLQNLYPFITSNGYDGLDIDWEYPASTEDANAFYSLMQGLRDIFPSPRYILSADVPPWGQAGYYYPKVEPLVDYYNVMMYDCAGPWTDDGQLNSPIFVDPRNPQQFECSPGGSVAQAAGLFLNDVHIPAAKLNMGTPFYGYFYITVSQLFGLRCTSQPCTSYVPSVNYGTFIKQRINQNGWQTYRDYYALVPYMLRTDGQPGFITYDDPQSTYTRVWYSLWQRGLGGTFLWSLDEDYDGHSQDLLDAMYQATLQQPLTVGATAP